MGAFEGERVVVVGAGVAGSAAARVLLAEGATVRVSESATARPGLSELRAAAEPATPAPTTTARSPSNAPITRAPVRRG